MIRSGMPEGILALNFEFLLYLHPLCTRNYRDMFPDCNNPILFIIESSCSVPFVFVCFVVTNQTVFTGKGSHIRIYGVVISGQILICFLVSCAVYRINQDKLQTIIREIHPVSAINAMIHQVAGEFCQRAKFQVLVIDCSDYDYFLWYFHQVIERTRFSLPFKIYLFALYYFSSVYVYFDISVSLFNLKLLVFSLFCPSI